MTRHISDDAYERGLCFRCTLDDCDQTTTSGCELKAVDARDKKDIYLFIKRAERSIDEIHAAFPNNAVSDTMILLSHCGLVKYNGGKWYV